MYHSISFDEKNTWGDWQLIPLSRPVFSPPPVKKKFIDVPGSDGLVDLTAIFSDFPIYENRTGSFEFIVSNDYLSWEQLCTDISVHLHGKERMAVLEDNPEYFYIGRFSINEWRSNKSFGTIVIDYNVEPYKIDIAESPFGWLWDPFDFEFSEIQYYSNLAVNGSLQIVVDYSTSLVETWEWDPFDFEYGLIQVYNDLGFDRPVVPRFVASSTMDVTFNGITYRLPKGTSTNPDIFLSDGSNIFTFTGNGIVSIEYGGRSL